MIPIFSSLTSEKTAQRRVFRPGVVLGEIGDNHEKGEKEKNRSLFASWLSYEPAIRAGGGSVRFIQAKARN